VILFSLFELSPESVAIDALGPFSTQEQRSLWFEQNGYSRPAVVRYVAWLGHLAAGIVSFAISRWR